MKKKYICSSICTVAMTAMLSIAALAAPMDRTAPCMTQQTTAKWEKLTDEQKAELKAKHDEMEKKWDTLDDKQKESVYKLKDKALDAENKIIDKYLEYGIIGEEDATRMKERISEWKTNMRENGKMPGHSKKYNK